MGIPSKGITDLSLEQAQRDKTGQEPLGALPPRLPHQARGELKTQLSTPENRPQSLGSWISRLLFLPDIFFHNGSSPFLLFRPYLDSLAKNNCPGT